MSNRSTARFRLLISSNSFLSLEAMTHQQEFHQTTRKSVWSNSRFAMESQTCRSVVWLVWPSVGSQKMVGAGCYPVDVALRKPHGTYRALTERKPFTPYLSIPTWLPRKLSKGSDPPCTNAKLLWLRYQIKVVHCYALMFGIESIYLVNIVGVMNSVDLV
jgi:hypothetical protein